MESYVLFLLTDQEQEFRHVSFFFFPCSFRQSDYGC